MIGSPLRKWDAVDRFGTCSKLYTNVALVRDQTLDVRNMGRLNKESVVS